MNKFKVTKTNKNIPKNFTGITEFPNGNKHWYKEGMFHRIDGPAVEWVNGYKEWWVDGKRHRIDGPAVEYSNGDKSWYIDDKYCSPVKLKLLIQNFLYFGKEKGKYNLDWLKFLTDQGIEEFYIVAGMEEDKEFKPLLDKVFEADKE